jgi:hypothetical protein
VMPRGSHGVKCGQANSAYEIVTTFTVPLGKAGLYYRLPGGRF